MLVTQQYGTYRNNFFGFVFLLLFRIALGSCGFLFKILSNKTSYKHYIAQPQPHSVYPKDCTNPHFEFNPSTTLHTSISPSYAPLPLPSPGMFQSQMSTNSGQNKDDSWHEFVIHFVRCEMVTVLPNQIIIILMFVLLTQFLYHAICIQRTRRDPSNLSFYEHGICIQHCQNSNSQPISS